MGLPEVTLYGTLKPDGTVDLDERPNLPTGRVEVVLRAVEPPPPTGQNWWHFLQRARNELERTKHPFMNDDEVPRYCEELRAGDERWEEIQQRFQEATQHEESP